jgi:hypothetical protein
MYCTISGHFQVEQKIQFSRKSINAQLLPFLSTQNLGK